jgi:hypothetical protein
MRYVTDVKSEHGLFGLFTGVLHDAVTASKRRRRQPIEALYGAK